MSLSYSLSIVTNLTPQQITKLIADKVRLRQTSEVDLEDTGMSVGVVRERVMSQQLMEEDFRLRPDICIVMGLHPSCGYTIGKQNIARVVAAVLRETDGDGVLLYTQRRTCFTAHRWADKYQRRMGRVAGSGT